jgi:hypothetical protein
MAYVPQNPGVRFEIKGLVIPKRSTFARGICWAAVEKSRFLADKPGFGMTRVEVLRKLHHYPPSPTSNLLLPCHATGTYGSLTDRYLLVNLTTVGCI